MKYRVEYMLTVRCPGWSEWEADTPEAAEALQREDFEINPGMYLDNPTDEEFDIEQVYEVG